MESWLTGNLSYRDCTIRVSGRRIDPRLLEEIVTGAPLGRYCASTSGLPHSSSHPFSIATAVYFPGLTFGRKKLPSRSLWSLRNSSTLSSTLDGISTIMTPAAGFPSLIANPSTATESARNVTVTDTVAPGATRRVLLEGPPPANAILATLYCRSLPESKIWYSPGFSPSNSVKPLSLTG